LESYQRNRLLIFIDPPRYDPTLEQGAWNIIQSLTAIVSGVLVAHGWTRGLLSQNNYLPVQYSDFIFAVTGEELGFVGATVLLLFEALLIWQARARPRGARAIFLRLTARALSPL